MARFLAAVCFVCAAFAWIPPYIDRAGLAALGFAFLALAIRALPAAKGQTLEGMLAGMRAAAQPASNAGGSHPTLVPSTMPPDFDEPT